MFSALSDILLFAVACLLGNIDVADDCDLVCICDLAGPSSILFYIITNKDYW